MVSRASYCAGHQRSRRRPRHPYNAHAPGRRCARVDGRVGVWHETYVVEPGNYENIYVNMPPFGLGKIGALSPAIGGLQSAAAG
jgi:hypothetical protein